MNRRSILITLAASLILLPVSALAAPLGRITGVTGTVEVAVPGKEAVKAGPGVELPGRTVIQTKGQGRCEIAFPDGSILRVAENSRLRLSASSWDRAGRPSIILVELTAGKIQNLVKTTRRILSAGGIFGDYSEDIRSMVKAAVKAGRKPHYEVRTPTAVYRTKGTDFFVYSRNGGSGAVVIEGSITAFSVKKPREVRQVVAGQAAEVAAPHAPLRVRAAGPLEREYYQKETVQAAGTPERAVAALMLSDDLDRLRAESRQLVATPATSTPPERPIVPPMATDYRPPDFAIAPRVSARADGAADLTVTLTGNEAAVFTSSLDGGEPVTGSLLNLTSLPAGEHSLTVEAVDAAQNRSTRTLNFTLENFSTSGALAGAVRGDVAVRVAAVAGRDWGGGNADLAGDAAVLPGTNWQARAGGALSDGLTGGYWLADMGGGAWVDGAVTGTVNYRSLTTHAFGSFSGPLSGAYQVNPATSLYDWQAAAKGVYAHTPLLFSGAFTGGYHQYENNLISYASPVSGYVGTTTSPFAAAGSPGVPGSPVDFHMMGETMPEGKTVWWGSLTENKAASGAVLPDGFIAGRAAGDTGGTEALSGFLAGLYVDEAGDAGLIEGSFAGLNHPLGDGSGIAEATSGALRATRKAAGYGDYDPALSLDWNYIDGFFAGSFRDGSDQPQGAIAAGGSIIETSAGFLGSYATWLRQAAAPESWGIFAIELGGQYAGVPADAWAMELGGTSWRALDEREYWAAKVTGAQWSGGQIRGSLRGNYLTTRALGTMTGDLLGSYDTFAAGAWEAVTLGSFEEQPLTFLSDLASDDGNLSALLGGTASLWTNAGAPAMMLGDLSGGSGLWSLPVWSDNFLDGSVTTYDGGAYQGFGYLVADSGQVADAGLAALYIDPEGKVGYLKGNLTGANNPDLGIFSAEGSLARTEIGPAPAGGDLSAASFSFSVLESGPKSLTLAGAPAEVGFLSETRKEAWIEGVTSWGIWQSELAGSSASAMPASWQWETAWGTDASYWTNYTDVTWLSEASRFNGAATGAGADWVNASTSVFGGEIKGLFDPATAAWKAVAQGAWLETTTFLELTASNPAALQAMNIPAIQVGSATLSQAAGTSVNNLSSVTLDNVRFFATSTGSVPRIWATNAVTGLFTAAPDLAGPAVPLSGGGLNANFELRNWNRTAGTWGALITGGTGTLSGGSYNGPVNFQGGAAGKIGAGSFTGTGAGVAK